MTKTFAIVGIVVVAILGIVGCSVLYANGLYAEGTNVHEHPLNAAYQGCQTELSGYVNGTLEQYGVLNFSRETQERIGKVVGDAASGRYDKLDASGKPSGTINSQLFFNALGVAENYPDLGMKEFLAQSGQLLTWVQSKRDSFANCQKGVLDRIAAYDNWQTKGGFIGTFFVRNILSFPTNELRAQIGTTVYYGPEALEKMRQLVLASEAVDAYNSGVDKPILP